MTVAAILSNRHLWRTQRVFRLSQIRRFSDVPTSEAQKVTLAGCFVLLATLLTWTLFTSPLFAQGTLPAKGSYEGQTVGAVDLIARPTMNVEDLRPLVLQKPGEPYSEKKVESTIAALERTHQFSKVDVEVTPESAGLRLQFILQPAFYIGMINFPGGVRRFPYSRLLQVVNYPAEEPYEARRVTDAQSALLAFFAENGYFASLVRSDTQLDNVHKLANVTFHVTLNKRAKVGHVNVTGPPPGDAARLERAFTSIRARLKGGYLKSGKPYAPATLQAATKFIQGTLARENRLASQVRLGKPNYNPETNRADVEFLITLGPIVSVKVEGARLSRRNMKKLIPIYEESSVDQDLIEEGERNIVSYFQNKGYFDVKVNPNITNAPHEVAVVYHIDKGNKHRVTRLKITGLHKFDQNDLSDQVVIEKARFFSRGKFSQDLLNRSVKNLTAFYQNAGFADVKVEPQVVDRESQLDVTFRVSEGEQTLVDSLQVVGNKTQALSVLAPDGLSLGPGRPYSRAKLDQDKSRVLATYLDRGYLNVDFNSTVKPVADNNHRVAVTYLINEGPQAHIGQVLYLGAPHTRQSFIERNVTVKPGAPLSEGTMLASESTLYNRGIFDWASVSPRKPVTDQTQEDVLVKAHEAERNSVTWGLGFESTPKSGSLSAGIIALPGLPTVGLPPEFEIIQKNVISPLGSLEYSRLNLRGRAETASISTLLSRLDQRASFTYTDPQFRSLNWSALWSVSAERTTQNPLFQARLGLASFQLERTLDAAKTKRLQFRYSFQRTTLTNLLIRNFIAPEDENIRSSMLSTSFVNDTRDKPLDAHKGLFQTLDFGVSPNAFGSTDNFVRFFGQTAYYREVKPWMVWANRVQLGMVKSFAGSHVPLSERFFSGGADTLRGFPLNGAGPQTTATLCTSATDLSTCTEEITVPVGGRQLFIINSEGRFPIPIKKGLGGAIFYDGGNVYQSINLPEVFRNYSNTVGFGLRYQTPVGPVRIDIGRNLNPVPGLKSTNIFVTLGQSF